jgi:hypothetical protein
LDKLVERRMRQLKRINLKEELEFKENISESVHHDGHEVFGE